jgi:alpha-ketoglutarate-dependent taurine dioxygenase
MAEAFESPANWTGEEIAGRADWLHEVASPALVDHLPLLKHIQDALENGPGVALIRGFHALAADEERAREFFLSMAREVGTPVSQSASGELVFSVRDAGFARDDPRARGPNTRRGLSFHTDRCDVIGFMCLNQARTGGENEIVSSVALYHEILKRRPDLLDALLEPYWYQRHNVDLGNSSPYCRQPVFSFQGGHFAASFLRVLIERAYQSPEIGPMPDRQREALDFLETVAGETRMHHRFVQRPGDVLFLNNWVTLHRRTEFEDHPEAERRRHILRVWLSMPNSRPLHPLFRDNYGATEAGALRGGMRAL